MPVKVIKSTGNARRQMSILVSGVSKKQPEKSLIFGGKNFAGRNNVGRLTIKNRGGGSKKLYRIVDFKQNSQIDKKAKVLAIEYDPNRTANIALLEYEDGTKSYILAPEGLVEGGSVVTSDKAAIRIGNRMRIKNIPASSQIFNVEMIPGRGGQMIRSAGNSAILLGIDKDYAQLRMPSGEIRKVSIECFASIGVVSCIDHGNIKIGKAGRMRLAGRKPHVRGKAKNPCDHPHGGGEGGTSIGLKYPKTPWGMPALGHKTRNKKKKSGMLIVKKRK
jgi:large subunit ribosomal protein L2